MPKYPATTATAPAVHQTAHRTRGGRWREGAGTGGDTVGVAGGEGDVVGVGGVSDVMGLSLVVSSLLVRGLILWPDDHSLFGFGRRTPGPSRRPVLPMAVRTVRGAGQGAAGQGAVFSPSAATHGPATLTCLRAILTWRTGAASLRTTASVL